MRHLRVLVVSVSALLYAVLPAPAQDARPPGATRAFWCSLADPVPFASRGFHYGGTRDTGVEYMGFQVFRFNYVQYAELSVPLYVGLVLTLWDANAPLAPTSPPQVGDSTLAYTGKMKSEGDIFDTAILAFRVGRYVHLWIASGHAADPLTDLTTVAERFFADSSASSVTPDAERLLAHLPTLSNLPPGLVLDDEYACDAAEPVGTPSS